MSDDRLTDQLAARVMRWRPAPNRFLKADRSWVARWRFQPLSDLANAFELLGQAAAHYTITCEDRTSTVEIHVGAKRFNATGRDLPRVISTAVARSVGLEVHE